MKISKNTISSPLVSIIIVTYNSSKYVIDTLESVKLQSYDNIELIISDDCSKDDTVKICQTWLTKNQERFSKTEIVTVKLNTGIPANCNRGINASTGEWIKMLAGDDILLPQGIYKAVNFINHNKNIDIFSSNIVWFEDSINFPIKTSNQNDLFFFKDNYSAKKQYHSLLKSNIILAPSVFIKKTLFHEIGYFDENIRYMEDYPFWIKCTSKGYKIFLLDQLTVGYRISAESVSNKKNQIFSDFYLRDYEFKKEHTFKHLNYADILIIKYNYSIKRYFEKLSLNKLKHKGFYNFLMKYNMFKLLKLIK